MYNELVSFSQFRQSQKQTLFYCGLSCMTHSQSLSLCVIMILRFVMEVFYCRQGEHNRMSSITSYTLTITLDSTPKWISWYVTDNSTDMNVLVQSNASVLANYTPYQTVQQHFSLPDNRSYVFILSNALGFGIDCKKNSSCYSLTVQNATDTLFLGYGNFTCIEAYNLDINAPRLQKPIYQGCPLIPLVYIPYVNYFVVVAAISVGILLICLLRKYRIRRIDRRMAEEDERRRQEEREIETELDGKLNNARKESILSLLPRTVLVDRIEEPILNGLVFTRIADLEKNTCPICLDLFKVNDEICSSSNHSCRHIFHTKCIMDWLLRSDNQVCPMCRNDFL